MKVDQLLEAKVIQTYDIGSSPTPLRAVLMAMNSHKGGKVVGVPLYNMKEISRNVFKYLIDGRTFRVIPGAPWEYKVEELDTK